MDRATCRQLHADIDAALAVIAKQYGMSLKTGTFRYSAEGVRAQITGLELSKTEVADPRLATVKPDYIKRAKDLGLFGKEFTYGNDKLTVTGHNGWCIIAWLPRRGSVKLNQAQTDRVMLQLKAVPRTVASV